MVSLSLCLLLSCSFLGAQGITTDPEIQEMWTITPLKYVLDELKKLFDAIENWYDECIKKYSDHMTDCTIHSITEEMSFKMGDYRYCGPGTNLTALGNISGINELDDACKEHDWAYASFNESTGHFDEIGIADKKLADKSWAIAQEGSADISEQATACTITISMDFKCKLERVRGVPWSDIVVKAEHCGSILFPIHPQLWANYIGHMVHLVEVGMRFLL